MSSTAKVTSYRPHSPVLLRTILSGVDFSLIFDQVDHLQEPLKPLVASVNIYEPLLSTIHIFHNNWGELNFYSLHQSLAATTHFEILILNSRLKFALIGLSKGDRQQLEMYVKNLCELLSTLKRITLHGRYRYAILSRKLVASLLMWTYLCLSSEPVSLVAAFQAPLATFPRHFPRLLPYFLRRLLPCLSSGILLSLFLIRPQEPEKITISAFRRSILKPPFCSRIIRTIVYQTHRNKTSAMAQQNLSGR